MLGVRGLVCWRGDVESDALIPSSDLSFWETGPVSQLQERETFGVNREIARKSLPAWAIGRSCKSN